MKLLSQKRAAGVADTYVDFLVIGLIVFVISMFFIFFVYAAEEQTNLKVAAQQADLTLDNTLLVALNGPFADSLIAYFDNPNEQTSAQLNEYFTTHIQSAFPDACTTLSAHVVDSSKENFYQPSFISDQSQKPTRLDFGECPLQSFKLTQATLPLYDPEQTIILQLTVEPTTQNNPQNSQGYVGGVSHN